MAKRKHYARIFNQIGLEAIKPFQFNNNDGYYRLAKLRLKPTRLIMFGLAREKQNYDPQKVLGEYRINQIKQAA